MKKQPPEPRRKPAQSRSRILVDAIIQACQQILEEEGVEHFSTNRIAEVAGVTIGSVYQYFPNKEAILASLFFDKIAAESEQMSRESTHRVLARMDESLASTLREVINIKAELHLRFFAVHGDFYREYHSFFDFHSQVQSLNINVYQQPSWDEWLPELLTKYQAEIRVDNVEQAAFITGNIIDRLLEAALEERPQWLSDDAYLQQVEMAVMNYIAGSKT